MVKINFVAVCPVPVEEVRANLEYSGRLGLPEVGATPVAPHLAVVGGGHSLANHIEELRAWDGEIWAINGTWGWLFSRGIETTFFSIDPSDVIDPPSTVRKAVLGDTCHRTVFDKLSGVDVEMARVGLGDIPTHATTAASAPMIAAWRGHKTVTFFGCDSSYEETTHIDRDESGLWECVKVECGGVEYLTEPGMIVQAEFISSLAREMPEGIKIRGEGFLPALVRYGDYDITAVSRNLMAELQKA